MVVAGGHSFDTVEFVDMFKSFSKYTFDTIMQPRANRMIAEGRVGEYDLIVFYDMWPEIDSVTKAAYYNLLGSGKGMVFLHHSLASYQDWPEFQNITGGRYISQEASIDSGSWSTYKHDLDLEIKVTRSDHPVTRNVNDFTIHDEAYGNIFMKSDAMVVLTTDHPDCYKNVGWVNTYGNSMIVYLMPGHDKNAYANEQYRSLLRNSMVFVNKQK